MGRLALAQIVAQALVLAAGWLSGRLSQACGQFGILAVGLVVQQIEIVLVLRQRQQDGDRLALRVNDVPRTALAQRAVEIVYYASSRYRLTAKG